MKKKEKPFISPPILDESEKLNVQSGDNNTVLPRERGIVEPSNLRSERMSTALNHPANVERLPINPYLRQVVEDLKKVEEYVTFGFPPPKAIVPLERKSNNKELHALLNYILSRLDNPKLADKFADFVAGALESIANKIEGK